MKITHKGLRAADRAHDLAKLNLFRGPVGSGKSTVLDAVALAALGYVPRVGRNEEATRRLINGQALSVTLTLDDGRTIERGLPKAKGTRAECRLSWAPKAKLTEAQTMATALFGAGQDDAEQNIDLRMLLAASPRERAKLVEAMLDGGRSAAEASARTARLMAARLAQIEESRVPEDRASQRVLSGSPVFDEVADAVAASMAKNGISLALETAKDAKNTAAADSRTKTAARGAIEDRKLNATAPAEAEEKLKARRDEAAARKTSAERDLIAESEQARRIADAEVARDQAAFAAKDAEITDPAALRTQAAELAARADAIVDPAPPTMQARRSLDADLLDSFRIARENAAAKSAEADRVDMPKPPERAEVPAEVRAAVEAKRAESARIMAEAAAIQPPEVPSLESAEAAYRDAQQRLGRAERGPWREVEKIAGEIESEFGADGHTLGYSNRLRSLAREHGGDLAEISEAVEVARRKLDEASIRAEAAQVARTEAQDRARELIFKANELAAEAEAQWTAAVVAARRANEAAERAYAEQLSTARTLQSQLRAAAKKISDDAAAAEAKHSAEVAADNAAIEQAHAAAMARLKADTERNSAERRVLRTQADALRVKADSVAVLRAKASEALAAAESRLEGLRAVTYDVPALQRAKADAEAEIADLDAKIRACGEAAARRREMAALVAEIERADALRAAWAAAETALRQLRDEDVARRAGPLVDRMRAFLRGAGRSEEPYVRCEGGVTDFGWHAADGSEVSLDGALSGGESVLMLTALAVAVIGLRAPSVRVLLIEAAELHGDDAGALLKGCAAIADGFEAVLVAGPASLPALEGWRVFDFEREAALAA